MNTILRFAGSVGATAGRTALRTGVGIGRWVGPAAFSKARWAASAIADARAGRRERSASGTGPAPRSATTFAAGPPRPAPGAAAPGPASTPGPLVPAPLDSGSQAVHTEHADALLAPPHEVPDADADALAIRETAAAAAEAAAIGGTVQPLTGDSAMDPVYQAGGGEQDGWEVAEAELIENATHGDGHADPLRDAGLAEVEADLATAEYAESDAVRSSARRDRP